MNIINLQNRSGWGATRPIQSQRRSLPDQQAWSERPLRPEVEACRFGRRRVSEFARRELANAREEALTANRAKSVFLSSMSHGPLYATNKYCCRKLSVSKH